MQIKKNKIFNKNFFKYACTKCGLCKDIFKKEVKYKANDDYIKLSFNKLTIKNEKKLKIFCPAYGFDYTKKIKDLNFDNLIGNYFQSYISYSKSEDIRNNSASGGILTEIIKYLLENREIDYVIMPLKKKKIYPEYGFTNDIKIVYQNSQSIYTKIPAVNTIGEVLKNNKRYCFVGLPDQTMAIRKIMEIYPSLKKRIKFIIGPMVGINMDRDSISGIKLIYNINKNLKIKEIEWREGEWPGNLFIKFSNNAIIRIKKFYYNFLLPFYCSHETLLSSDFSNEASDISVGDAWSPKFEKLGKGWSVVWSKNKKGDNLLKKIGKRIFLKKISTNEAKKMHLHMLDFKKRGSQYRREIYKFFKIPVPNNITKKTKKKLSRFMIEIVIIFTIWICKSNFGKKILKYSSPSLLGKFFSFSRVLWKKLTYSTKRDKINEF